MAAFRYRFVLLGVIAAVALMFGGGSLAPRTALAAGVNIDPTSCAGVGYPNCPNLPANVTIGANSCTVISSCDHLGDGAVIGANSCNGVNACSYNGYGGTGSVGDNSCDASEACYHNGRDGSGSVGDNSCNASDACFENGRSGSGRIGDNSCNGEYACEDSGSYGGTGAVGDYSCNGFAPCDGNAYEGSGSVGDNSCNIDYACNANGYQGSGSVGDSSCNGKSACEQNGFKGAGSVGDASCRDNNACYQNGFKGAGSVGDASCNGTEACYQNGDPNASACSLGSPGVVSECGLVDSGVLIGNLSCNQTGTYNANCQGLHEDVGNCMYNDETPLLCTQGTIDVVKVVVGNSSDRFNLKVDGVVRLSNVGNGASTEARPAAPGTHSVGESAVYPARLSDYDQRTTCVAYNAIVGSHSHTIVPRTRGTAVFNVNAGDVVTCTITNTKQTGFFPFRR